MPGKPQERNKADLGTGESFYELVNDMNYETDIAPRLAEGKNAATIASEINAERRAAELTK